MAYRDTLKLVRIRLRAMEDVSRAEIRELWKEVQALRKAIRCLQVGHSWTAWTYRQAGTFLRTCNSCGGNEERQLTRREKRAAKSLGLKA